MGKSKKDRFFVCNYKNSSPFLFIFTIFNLIDSTQILYNQPKAGNNPMTRSSYVPRSWYAAAYEPFLHRARLRSLYKGL